MLKLSQNNPKVASINDDYSHEEESGTRRALSCSFRKKIVATVFAIFLLLVIVVIVLSITLNGKKNVEKNTWNLFRLPRGVTPIHYDIQLFPDMYSAEAVSLMGNETILVTVRDSTNVIQFNILDINITTISLQYSNTTNFIEIEKTVFNKTTNMYAILTKEDIVYNSEVLIQIGFAGLLSHSMEGLYKGYFNVPSDNRTRYIVSTQFEPASARLAFPCFDEPHLKAIFSMKIVHKKSHRALFNTRELYQSKAPFKHPDGSDLVITHFEKMPHVMSSYLVALAVVESYDFVYGNTTDGREMRYFAPEHRIIDLKYAAVEGRRAREYLDSLLDMKSPLKKVDMITIPQFKAGAMENWGLITYRENLLLLKSDDLDINKYSISRVIAHELVHTWFGNIVTLKWWNELFLNEAFATYFAAVTTDNINNKDWNTMEFELIRNRNNVMYLDMHLNFSKPIIQEVEKRTQMRGMFNSFVYQKGGALLKWFEIILGKDNFFNGIKAYLKANRYSTGTKRSLFSHLQDKIPSILINNLMMPWLSQKGYPIVSITFSPNKKVLTLSQQSIFIPPNKTYLNIAPYNNSWEINVSIKCNSLSSPIIKILTVRTKSINFPAQDIYIFSHPGDWLLLNSNSYGYYRSHYDAVLFDAMVRNLIKLNQLQRAIFLGDVFELVNIGLYSYTQAFRATLYLHKEKFYSPWYLIYSSINRIERLMNSNDLQMYMRNKTTHLFDYWNSTIAINSEQTLLFPKNLQRELFFGLACQFAIKSDPCRTKVQAEFKSWLLTKSISLPKELTRYVFFYGIEDNNTDDNWNILFDEFKKISSTNEFKMQLIYGLISSPSSNRFNQLLPVFLKTDKGLCIGDADLAMALKILTSTRKSTRALWLWTVDECGVEIVNANQTDFCKLFVKKAVVSMTAFFYDDTERAEVKKFLSGIPKDFITSSLVDKVNNKMNFNKNWRVKYFEEIETFLKSNV